MCQLRKKNYLVNNSLYIKQNFLKLCLCNNPVWQVQSRFPLFFKMLHDYNHLMLLNFSYVFIASSHLVCKLGTGNMGFPKISSRCLARKSWTSIYWISASSCNSGNHTKGEVKISGQRSIKSGLQVILILPILIVACLLITSCESGVNLVTSCNRTFLF